MQEESKPMGIGEIGKPSTVFARKFRWTLSGNGLSESFIQKVFFDFKKKKIKFEVLEACTKESDIDIQSWVEKDLSKETLIFTTYDGCGRKIYTYRMTGLNLVADCSSFDYSSSDISTRDIALEYEKIERETRLKSPCGEKVESVSKKRFVWKIGSVESSARVTVRASTPNVKIEETEISYLNCKTWIPGKAIWETLELISDSTIDKIVLRQMIENSDVAILDLYDTSGVKKLESWKLINCRIDSMENFSTTIKFDGVEYRSEADVDERE